MKTYQLYVKVGGIWKWEAMIKAATHADALREAIGRLRPEHYDKPIRLEQADDKPE